MFFAADGRSVDLRGACFPRHAVPAATAAEDAEDGKAKIKTKPKVKPPPVSAEKHRRASPGVTTSRFAQIRKTLIWLPGPLGEGAFKSVNRNR